MEKTTTKIDLVINKLSQAKYNELASAGKLDPNQLYFTTDAPGYETGRIVGEINPGFVSLNGRVFDNSQLCRNLDPGRKYNWEFVFANYSTARTVKFINTVTETVTTIDLAEMTTTTIDGVTVTSPAIVVAQDPEGPYASNAIPPMSIVNGSGAVVTIRIYDAGPV